MFSACYEPAGLENQGFQVLLECYPGNSDGTYPTVVWSYTPAAGNIFEQVEIDGEPLKIPAIMPRLSETPGATDWPGGDAGSHTEEILGDLLSLSEEEIAALRAEGVVD